MVKYSGLDKFSKLTEEDLISQFFPESAHSLPWEEFENDIFFQYDKDFTISISMKKDKTKKEDSPAMDSPTMGSAAIGPTIIDLKEGSNTGNDKIKINMTLEKLRTLESGLCYKISSDMETFDKIQYFSLQLKEHLNQYISGKFTKFG